MWYYFFLLWPMYGSAQDFGRGVKNGGRNKFKSAEAWGTDARWRPYWGHFPTSLFQTANKDSATYLQLRSSHRSSWLPLPIRVHQVHPCYPSVRLSIPLYWGKFLMLWSFSVQWRYPLIHRLFYALKNEKCLHRTRILSPIRFLLSHSSHHNLPNEVSFIASIILRIVSFRRGRLHFDWGLHFLLGQW